MGQLRREPRMIANWVVDYEKVPDQRHLFEHLRSYTNIGDGVGHQGTIPDMSVNGCRIIGHELPLAAKVACLIAVPDFRVVEALGLVLWKTKGSFGLLFEWISLEVRTEIAERVRAQA